ncbi:hypothetical protein DFH28DRAFT_174270 [Melampsora americana]|nr:hypothetical protein DFH28DRAFT_174270 [Melampsora americana]
MQSLVFELPTCLQIEVRILQKSLTKSIHLLDPDFLENQSNHLQVSMCSAYSNLLAKTFLCFEIGESPQGPSQHLTALSAEIDCGRGFSDVMSFESFALFLFPLFFCFFLIFLFLSLSLCKEETPLLFRECKLAYACGCPSTALLCTNSCNFPPFSLGDAMSSLAAEDNTSSLLAIFDNSGFATVSFDPFNLGF